MHSKSREKGQFLLGKGVMGLNGGPHLLLSVSCEGGLGNKVQTFLYRRGVGTGRDEGWGGGRREDGGGAEGRERRTVVDQGAACETF